ncbi:zinc finger protein 726-like isoform X2 [Sitophilus oryzae]|uniref:Zinc finger protein 726-like isoform X2 n=1 Tax=Sitophilus oryzae TaxID=7048 RepID=A0A6J2YCS1_SITOR|nr:zinc finger protein 726-like isoform X2 [Sitophilus oryzae]
MVRKCRICMIELDEINSINLTYNCTDGLTVLQKLVEVSSVNIPENDTLGSQYICRTCFCKLEDCYIFRNLIISSESKFRALECKTTMLDLESIENSIVNDINSINNYDNEKFDPLSDVLYNDLEKDQENVRACDEFFSDKLNNTLDSEEEKKFEITAIKERLYKCGECCKSFKKCDHLRVHMMYKHCAKQFQCNVCYKKFARKYDLAYHHRVHTGERPYKCETCGKSFGSSNYFNIHKKIHSGVRKHKCEHCQSAFVNSEQLQIHVRQKHTGEKPYMCESCSRTFTSSSTLHRHKRDVHGEKVPCPQCSRLFSRRVLSEHLKRHREKEAGIKKFSCEECDKKFTCYSSKKRHMAIHSGEKAFKCL